MTRWLLISLIALAPLAVNAELYRWVDDEGRVHFGDRAPDDQAGEAEQLEVEPPKPIGQGTDLKQINERLEVLREKEREREEAKQAEAEKRAQEQQEMCKEKRRRYNRMKGKFVYERDDGSVYEVSREQVRKDQAALLAWLEKNCSGN